MFSSTEILVFITTILFALYFWIKYKFSYWKRTKVPYIKPSLIFGNLRDIFLMKTSPAEGFQKLYHDSAAENEPILGIYVFHKPGLVVRDPELIKRILVKDFNKFPNRYSRTDPHTDILGSNLLFFMTAPEWKAMRTKLSPTFTSGKMKQMFTLVDDIGKELDRYVSKLIDDSKENFICVEIKEICSLFTTDVIGNIAFGVNANSLKNPKGDFRKTGKDIFDFNLKRALEMAIIFFLPEMVSFFKSKFFPRKTNQFLRTTITQRMDEREKSGTSRNDLIDFLIALKKASENSKDKNEIHFKGDVIVAQSAQFFAAGSETSSGTMSFCLYELAKNTDVLNRLRQEIKKVLLANDGEITYDSVQKMEYLNMVIQETLRLYPPLPFLDRECSLPEGENEYSLQPFSDYKIPNGMPLYIPIYAMQYDPKYFPNPEIFDPERFTPENKRNIIPYSYMPFGLGPRVCIGERLGLLLAKIGIIYVLKNYSIRPSPNSPKMMVLDKKALILQAEGGIYCELFRDPLLQ